MISNEIRQSLQFLCSNLNEYEVEYMIIGGIAVGFYGYQRVSGSFDLTSPQLSNDVDVWYNPTNSNFINLTRALKKSGIDTTRLENIVFDPTKTYLRIPFGNFKAEFLPQMKGLDSFAGSLSASKNVTLDGNRLNIINLADLIANKEAVNREIDKRDIIELKRIHGLK
ncbi:MAG: hypothetical protein JXQ96_21975 [Cyclobacteriaceae bacterium]